MDSRRNVNFTYIGLVTIVGFLKINDNLSTSDKSLKTRCTFKHLSNGCSLRSLHESQYSGTVFVVFNIVGFTYTTQYYVIDMCELCNQIYHISDIIALSLQMPQAQGMIELHHYLSPQCTMYGHGSILFDLHMSYVFHFNFVTCFNKALQGD